MRYERFVPDSRNQPHVEHLWLVEAGHRVKREILIPNGRPTLAICLGTPGVRHDPLTGAHQRNDSVLFGITTRPYVLEQQGLSSYVGAQLAPWGVAALLPQDRLVDTFVPVDTWLSPGTSARLADELRGHDFGEHRARVLDDFLGRHLNPVDRLPLLRKAVTAIDDAQGRLSVNGLSTRLSVSSSSLYRLFRTALGVGPKQFCDITRYYYFTGELLGTARGSEALLAAMHGYYDQAHAAGDFKRFTGLTAGSFRQIQNGIARLMHSD